MNTFSKPPWVPALYRMLVDFAALVVVQSLSSVRLFLTPWTAAHQAVLSSTSSQTLLKLTSIESVMPTNHPILCRPLLLLPSIFPSIRVFCHLGPLLNWLRLLLAQESHPLSADPAPCPGHPCSSPSPGHACSSMGITYYDLFLFFL
ncbi:unnamed protein product [Rangifer tarandus platyrhynchus]|uniref:Uncharacterized protein n=1 Tax=Rangifer tarandus platyrhynchus TaxID=3082113 RepID=A0ABN8YFX2_RANTA|nr:unnamed protein product [Rangifer tarandus platyrhynchus]